MRRTIAAAAAAISMISSAGLSSATDAPYAGMQYRVIKALSPETSRL